MSPAITNPQRAFDPFLESAWTLLPREHEVLQSLSPIEREHYESVRKLLVLARDRCGWNALQCLLLKGALPGGRDLLGEGTTLQHLARLATGRLSEGIDRVRLLGNVVRELVVPEPDTGLPRPIASEMAQQCPAEYVRVVCGLAGPKARTVLANGVELESPRPHASARTLLASAFLEGMRP